MEALQRQLPAANPQDLANTAWALGVLAYSPPPSWAAAFYAESSRQLPHLAPQHFANLLWGFSQLSWLINPLPGKAWVDAFLLQSYPRLRACRPQELATLLYALAVLGERCRCRRPPCCAHA
jgi:hypothetical protein